MLPEVHIVFNEVIMRISYVVKNRIEAREPSPANLAEILVVPALNYWLDDLLNYWVGNSILWITYHCPDDLTP